MTLLRKRLLLLAGSFFALAVLLLLFPQFIRQAVVIPIHYALWFASLVLNSIHQQVLWSALLLLSAIIAARLLHYAAKAPRELPAPPAFLLGQGRVAAWLLTVRLVRSGRGSQEHFAAEVKKLLLAILAQRERMSPKEVEAQIESGGIPIPAELRFAFESPSFHRPDFASRLRSRLSALGRQNAAPERQHTAALQAIIHFLEDQMEGS